MKENLLDIFENEKVEEIIPFLRSLDKTQRDSLVPMIKQQHKDYTTYHCENGKNNYKGSMAQFTILSIEMFICFNFKDYKQNYYLFSFLGSGFIGFHRYSQQELMLIIKIEDILEWYVPEWIDDFLNDKRLNIDYAYASYGQLIRWMQKGYISRPTPELLAYTLCEHAYELTWDENQKRHTILYPERLLEFEITLKEHVWLLFRYQTMISLNIDKESNIWNNIFKYLLDNKHIDRIKLLKEILLATNGNFNKLETAFFVNLFNELEPSDQDLLILQPELLSTLMSPQTRAVNSVLSHIKKICTFPSFQAADFIAFLPTLLSSTIKSTISTSIDIASNLIAKNKNLQADICLSLCLGFISKDESIQKKTAKTLAKYGDVTLLSDTIQSYKENILASVKPLLKNIITVTAEDTTAKEEQTLVQIQKKPLIRTDNKITEIEKFDDFLFFINQIFNSSEPYHSFMLPAYLSKFNKYITADNVWQLGPACKEAKLASSYNNIFASLFLSYIEYLHSKYPDATVEITEGIGTWYSSLNQWKKNKFSIIKYPYYHLFKEVITKINKDKELQLISTPTHLPLWIDPVILVERISWYQNNNTLPDSIDLQMAIQQTALDNTEKALFLAEKELKDDELKHLIIYLLDRKSELPDDAEHPAWWITASLIKNPYSIPTNSKICDQHSDKLFRYNVLGDYKWKIEYDKWNDKKFTIDRPEQIFYDTKVTDTSILIEYTFKHKDLIWGTDIQQHIYANPYSHAGALAGFLSSIETFSSFSSNDKKGFIGAMTALYELELPFMHTNYLLLAWAMICPDRVSRDFAGELWAKATSLQTIDNEKFGKYILDFLATGEFPIKRLTDLIENKLIDFGTEHQKELIKLINTIITHQKESASGFKKLLEIYSQLLSVCKEKVCIKIASILEEWQQIASLKKVIKQIID